MERLSAIWNDVRSSLWFRPGLLTILGIGAAFGMLGVDRWVASVETLSLPIGLGGDPQSARDVLSTIAGGMITLAGVSFSIVVIALTLASHQFAPRVLRNFTSDRVNQTTLGVFVGTFAYSVLVLRVVRGDAGGSGAYVPAAGVLLAIVAAVVSLGFFLYFIHHIATSIQVSQIVRSVTEDTHRAIERMLGDERAVTGPARIRAAPIPVPDGWRVAARGEGYVEQIDEDGLVAAAADAGATLELLVGPGDFVAEGSPLAVTESSPADPEPLADAVRGAIVLGRQRTILEDPAFGIRELVDIAVKAISPSMNDPNTAMNCVDYLGSLLRRMADRDWPAGTWVDEAGAVRVRVPTAGFEDYVALAFTEIRRYGHADLAVTLRLLEALGGAADATARPDRRAALWEEAVRLAGSADRGIDDPADRRAVDERLDRLAAALGRNAAPHHLAAAVRQPTAPSPDTE